MLDRDPARFIKWVKFNEIGVAEYYIPDDVEAAFKTEAEATLNYGLGDDAFTIGDVIDILESGGNVESLVEAINKRMTAACLYALFIGAYSTAKALMDDGEDGSEKSAQEHGA